jgi:ABC-type branched-subunit amino acid transport system substrate-binding protein
MWNAADSGAWAVVAQGARLFGLLAALLAITGTAASCRAVAPEVKIGLVGPFEGKERAVGYDVIYSARLAVRQVNEAGGIGRYRIGLVALDDFGDPEMAAKSAESLILDPQVVAVVGHWGEATSMAARPLYDGAGVPFLAGGAPPLAPFDPDRLPPEFAAKYAETTPFDEMAGPHAGPAYDAMYLLFAAMEQALAESGAIDRQSLEAALDATTHLGVTGVVFRP